LLFGIARRVGRRWKNDGDLSISSLPCNHQQGDTIVDQPSKIIHCHEVGNASIIFYNTCKSFLLSWDEDGIIKLWTTYQ